MKETELKACPFCGGEAELHETKLYLCDAVQIHCKKCSVHTPKEVFNHLHYSAGEAIYVTQTMAIERVTERWNRRESDAFLVVPELSDEETKKALAILKNQRPQIIPDDKPEAWISVDDRLPDVCYDSYLVVVKLKYEWETEWEYNVDVADFVLSDGYIDDVWNTLNDWNEGQECHVTHWMPLPEPPKMKGGAE